APRLRPAFGPIQPRLAGLPARPRHASGYQVAEAGNQKSAFGSLRAYSPFWIRVSDFRPLKMRGLILLIILALGGWYLLSPDGRAFLDRMRINWTRWEDQNRFRSGQPLPGTPDLA